MRAVVALYDRLINLLAAATALLIGALSLWITYDVVMRYFFRAPTIWAIDLSEYALVWSVFLAAPWAMREGAHITMEIAVERLPAPIRRNVRALTSVVAAAVCLVMAWEGGVVTWDLYVRNVDFAREWVVRQYAVYLIIPVGFFLLAVESLLQAMHVRHSVASMEEVGEQRAIY